MTGRFSSPADDDAGTEAAEVAAMTDGLPRAAACGAAGVDRAAGRGDAWGAGAVSAGAAGTGAAGADAASAAGTGTVGTMGAAGGTGTSGAGEPDATRNALLRDASCAPPPPAAPPLRGGGIAFAATTLAAVAASFWYLAIDYRELLDAGSLRRMGQFVAEFFPPDLSREFLDRVAWGAVQTLALSAVGTLLAAAGGALLAVPAAGRAGRAGRAASRSLLNVLRSVPELVWAALMVLAAGLGPFAGALALALHTAGVLGRLFAETLENAPPAPERALRETGAGCTAAFLYGTLAGVWAQAVAYTLYRWEINIRMAAVLGFVGAGGLGQLLYFHLSLFQQPQVATVLVAMLLLVFGVDAVGSWLRRGLAPAYA